MASTDPKTATQGQWEDLADRVQSKAEIGTDLSTPSSVVFVQTANIANGAVTKDKLAISGIIDVFYPVGSYYETSDTTFNPNTAWGGTWVEDTAGRVLVSLDSGTFSTVGGTGGEETHTLTVAEMPSHNHTLSYTANSGGTGTSATYGTAYSAGNQSIIRNATIPTSGELKYWGIDYKGGDGPHNNLQPYVVVKRWHRTA